jgi:hypothetical protein
MCTEARLEWLNKIAQDRARIEGNTNWEKKIKQMIHEAKERSVNRKLTTATKGAYRPLNTIQIPTHEWFYSEHQNELYHYEQGNFKAHPPTTEHSAHTFRPHHTLKFSRGSGSQMTIFSNWFNDQFKYPNPLICTPIE